MPPPILQSDPATRTNYLVPATPVQGVRPRAAQRGVFADGMVRVPASFGAVAANPFGEAWDANRDLGGIDLALGVYAPTQIDLTLPAHVPWVVGRSFNPAQRDAAGQPMVSHGPQGDNWFQSSEPEMVRHFDAQQQIDAVYLVYGAGAFVELRRGVDGVLRGVNGVAGAMTYTAADDTFVYTDQRGWKAVFFGFSAQYAAPGAAGHLWKILDPAAAVTPGQHAACIGGTGTAAAAAAAGYLNGLIRVAYDSSGARFSYSYSPAAVGAAVRLTAVTAEKAVQSGGQTAWVEVGRVDYEYYTAATADGSGAAGDLGLVTTTTPLTGDGAATNRLVAKRHFRYDAAAAGHPIRLEVGPEGVRKYERSDDLSQSPDRDVRAATSADLVAYSSIFLQHATSGSITVARFSGEATGATPDEYRLSVGPVSPTPPDVYAVTTRAEVVRPDLAREVRFFDGLGQPMSTARIADGVTPRVWWTGVRRTPANGAVPAGLVSRIFTPASVASGVETTGTFSTRDAEGLVLGTEYYAEGDADASDRVQPAGFPRGRWFSQGAADSATRYLASAAGYEIVTDRFVCRPVLAASAVFPDYTTDEALGQYTTYDHAWFRPPLRRWRSTP